MKSVYYVVFTKCDDGYLVTVPDFNANTFGKDYDDAAYMARDVIGILGITKQDYGEDVPAPSNMGAIKHEPNETVVPIEIDFDEYRIEEEEREEQRERDKKVILASLEEGGLLMDLDEDVIQAIRDEIARHPRYTKKGAAKEDAA